MNAMPPKPNKPRKLRPDEVQTAYQRAVDLNSERALLGRAAIIAGFCTGGVGVLALIVTVVMIVMFLPLRRTEGVFYQVDKSTGIISQPVTLKDAPVLFDEVTDRHYLTLYLQARLGYVADTDRRSDHLVKIMSAPGEQARYTDERAKAIASKTLGRDGTALIEHVRFFNDRIGGPARAYTILADRVTVEGLNTVRTPYTIHATFEWHPDLPMVPEDRDQNPGGFQMVAFTATNEAEQRKPQ